jgi:hypothetical protein
VILPPIPVLIFPVAVIDPAVLRLAPVILPEALIVPIGRVVSAPALLIARLEPQPLEILAI